jgi:endonuclease/exonuclease/phosphatase family metal-dependent hydrolase
LRPTWPAPPRRGRALPLTIDHVLVDRRVRVERVTVVRIPHSDHRAVIAVLRLPTP